MQTNEFEISVNFFSIKRLKGYWTQIFIFKVRGEKNTKKVKDVNMTQVPYSEHIRHPYNNYVESDSDTKLSNSM